MAAGSGFYADVDEVTLGRARRGDVAAIETIYRRFATPVYNLGRRLCGSPEEADDVLQETFLEVVRSVHRFRGDGAFGAWMRQVAASKALARLRRHASSRERAGGDDPGRERAAEDAAVETRLDLERALARLNVTARAVVWLHDVEGLTHGEIASLMDRSESFSKSQLARAHTRMREWLGRLGSEDHASRDRRAVGAAGR